MKIFVMMPTYNESQNIRSIIESILKLKINNLEIAVVDDNSPDSTWKIVEEISKNNNKVHLLLRKKDKGRGSAGKDGFIYCLKKGADYIIEMDADFSHNPQYIPKMLEEMKNCDVVLGSRIKEGGMDTRKSILRRAITKLANIYIRVVLGLNVKDCNSGFRCFKREALMGINPEKLESKGPSIVQEVLFKIHLNGFKIKEIPIVFNERKRGKSKLGIRQLISGYLTVLKLRFFSK